MLKTVTTLGLAIMLAFSIANAQQAKLQKIRNTEKVVASETNLQSGSSFYTDYMNRKLGKKAMTPVNGDTLVFADYDYAANTAIRQMIDPYDFDGDGLLNPLATAMTRKVGSLRAQEFIYGDPNGYANTVAFDTVANKYNFGFGQMQTAKAGPLKGKSMVVSHANSLTWFTTVDLSTFAPSAPVKFGNNFPSFFYVDNGTAAGTIWANSAAAQKIYKSTDKGATWATVDSFSHYMKYSSTGFPSEIEVQGSSDGKYLSMHGGFALGGNGSSTLPKDSTDYVGWLHSEDGGATWKADKIGYDGYNGQISNRPGQYTYFQNFGQILGSVDDKGTTHLAANGYGEFPFITPAKDTLYYVATPILYWNSVGKKWIAVTDQKVDQDTNYNADLRPGNGIASSYPSVSVSSDGKVVFVIWEQNEYTGTPGASSYNIYPGDNTANTAKIYYSDIFASYSTDGGNTFVAPFAVASKKSLSEVLPSVARKLDIKNGKATAHFVYFEDKIPGQSLFATNNSRATGEWIYKTYTFNAPTGVEDQGTIVNRFDLEQNYPNPFNPTTQITYSLEKSGLVTLKVYDVLGKEVATLVSNKAETAGKHSVSFNASNFTSGMYIYTLTSGNAVVSKKMMLLK